MMCHRSLTRFERKRNIFLNQRWFLLVILLDILLFGLAVLNRKPFDLGDFVITISLVNTILFYFLLLNIRAQSDSIKNNYKTWYNIGVIKFINFKDYEIKKVLSEQLRTLGWDHAEKRNF